MPKEKQVIPDSPTKRVDARPFESMRMPNWNEMNEQDQIALLRNEIMRLVEVVNTILKRIPDHAHIGDKQEVYIHQDRMTYQFDLNRRML